MRGLRILERETVEPAENCRRPAIDRRPFMAKPVWDRHRAGHASGRKVIEQAEKERQLICADPILVESEDKIAAICLKEEVRVFDPFRYALKASGRSDIV